MCKRVIFPKLMMRKNNKKAMFQTWPKEWNIKEIVQSMYNIYNIYLKFIENGSLFYKSQLKLLYLNSKNAVEIVMRHRRSITGKA